jgi:hypothetical protein
MGAATTDIVIERGVPLHASAESGGQTLLAIASAFSMSFTDAERLKRRGFAPTGDPVQWTAGAAKSLMLQRMVSEIMRFSLTSGAAGRRSGQSRGACGGGACLRNIIPSCSASRRSADSPAAGGLASRVASRSAKRRQSCVAL